MKTNTDKELAVFLLKERQHGGQTWWQHLKTHARYWTFAFGFMMVLLGLAAFVEAWVPFGVVLGLVAGILSRASVWIQHQRAAWPFYAKVLDWEKVTKIANETPPAMND